MPETTQHAKPKRRILFMLPMLSAGGAERVLITLMNNLDPQDFEPHFLALSDEGTTREWIAPSVPFHSFHQSSMLRCLGPMISLIRALKPDILMTTMVRSNAMALLMKMIFPKLTVIIRESSLPAIMVKEYGYKGYVARFVYRFLYPLADLVICPSHTISRQFAELGYKTSNHAVLYNPVDQEKIEAALQTESPDAQKTPSDRVRFVWLGRLSYEKGLDRLFEALAEHSLSIDWQLDILGEGGESAHLQALCARLGLSDHIRFLGYQAQPWPLISAADCLLLPSRWEGMPNVVLEALACGVPVIAHADAGAVDEIMDHAAAGDLKVASSMEGFVQHMQLVSKTSAPESRSSKLPAVFSLETIAAQFQKLLHRAMD